MEKILILVIIGLSVFTLYLLHWIIKIKNELNQIMDILSEIKDEGSKQKFLLTSNGNIDKIKALLNDIFYKYEHMIEEFTISSHSNQQLMTSLSHDVRTPMTTLMGYLDAIYMRPTDGNKREQYIQMAKDKAYDIKDYMDVLFEWFRLNSNDEIFKIERVDIAELSREVLKDWVPVLEEKGIHFDINIPEYAIHIEMDFSCYSRIINNILQNILIHSYADKITISADQGNDMFVLKIEDNGIGIPDENLKYIFERLYKCDESRQNKGTGLGLNIVKILTERMQGKVEAHSKVNVGTSFIIRFPLYK